MPACSDHHNPDHFDRQKLSFRLIKHDDKFLSKETSKSNPSFRIYYGDAPSAVPFVWEKCPGTPKHHPSSCTQDYSYNIPPLTPPPSYYTNATDRPSKKQSRSKLLLHSLLRRMNNNHSKKAGHVTTTSSCRSSSSSSSMSSLSWSSMNSHSSSFSDQTMTPSMKKRRRFSSWGYERSTVGDFGRRDEVCPSRFCFRIGKDNGERVLLVKKAFLAIVGRGSAA